jgi:iron complex outermembrane receptor protein
MGGAIALFIISAPALGAQQSPPDSTRRDSIPTARLAPVVVTVARSADTLAFLPRAVSVIRGAALTRGRTAEGLDDVIRAVPGILAVNRYNYALDQRIVVRGAGARSAFGVRGVQVLLDGIPQTLPDGQGQLTNVDLGDVERIEIVRGASSALYGNASGGVVILRSALDRPERAALRGRIQGGSFTSGKVLGSVSAPLGAGAVHATGSWMTTDGFREHSHAELRRAMVRTRMPLAPSTRLTVTGGLAHMPDAQNPGALTQLELDSLPSMAAPRNVALDARKSVWQGQGGMAVEHEFSPRVATEVGAFLVRRDLDNPLTFATILLDRWAYGVRGAMTVGTGAAQTAPRVTVGVDAQWQRDDRRNVSTDGTTVLLDQFERVGSLGPFVQARIAPSPAVRIVAGARYDRVAFAVDDRQLGDGDQTGARAMDALSGSIGVSLHAIAGVAPWVNLSTAFETPTTTELVNRPDGTGGLNPELGPQRTVSVELGVRGTAWSVVGVELVVYRATVRDAVVPFESPTVPDRQFFRNAGRLRHRGVELALDATPWPGVSVTGAYTLDDSRFVEFRVDQDTLDGNTVPGIPRHRLFGEVTLTRPSGLWASLEVAHMSRMFADDANTGAAKASTVFGLRVGWEGIGGRRGVSPFVTVMNLFDTRYVSSVVVNAAFSRFYEPAPGRTLLLGLTVGG